MRGPEAQDPSERFSIVVRTPVRISFSGGGTDLPGFFRRYGGAVLSASIDKYVYSSVAPRPDSCVQVSSCGQTIIDQWPGIRDAQPGGGQDALTIPISVLRHLGPVAGLNLALESDVPPGTGLGSSASACVGALHALGIHAGRKESKRELAEAAFSLVSRVLRKPVGKQDEFAASFGGLNYFEFNPDGSTCVVPVSLDPETLRALERRLMLFFTGVVHNSWVILKEHEDSIDDGKEQTIVALHRLRELAKEMKTALLEKNLRRFGLLLHQAWEEKRAVSTRTSSPEIDRLYHLARKNGALGGKITGAGGGGCMLLFCDEEHQPAVREVFATGGAQELQFQLDHDGSKVLKRCLASHSCS